MMLKPSAAPASNHSLDRVGDLLRRTGEGAVAAAAAEPADQLADRQPLATGQRDDQRVAALGPLDLVLVGQVGGQLPVEGQVLGPHLEGAWRAGRTAYSGRISSSSSRSSRWASASVPPITGTMPGRILMLSGSRPIAAVRAP